MRNRTKVRTFSKRQLTDKKIKLVMTVNEIIDFNEFEIAGCVSEWRSLIAQMTRASTFYSGCKTSRFKYMISILNKSKRLSILMYCKKFINTTLKISWYKTKKLKKILMNFIH